MNLRKLMVNFHQHLKKFIIVQYKVIYLINHRLYSMKIIFKIYRLINYFQIKISLHWKIKIKIFQFNNKMKIKKILIEVKILVLKKKRIKIIIIKWKI